MDVVCALIWKNGKLLAVRRGSSVCRSGEWEFPGGKVRKNENPEPALRREVEEELGIRVKIIRRLPSLVHRYPEVTIRLIPFVSHWIRGNIILSDHDEIRWLEPGELQLLDWSEADRNLIHFLNGLSQLNEG